MELQFLSFPFLFMSLSFLLFLSLILFKAPSRTQKLPPGPWMLPLFGSIHHLVGSLPHHRLRELAQKYGSLMHLKLGERSTIVVSSPQVAKQVFKTHDVIFAQRPHFLGGDIVLYGSIDIGFSPYGDYWRQLRKICTQELLSVKRVRSYQSIREAEVLNLVRYISTKTGSSINLSEKIYSTTYAITARAAFGERCKDQEAFISVVKEIMKAAAGFNVTDLFPSKKWLHVITGEKHKFEEIHRRCDMVLQNIINEAVLKIEGEAESLLSVLLKLKDCSVLEFPLTINNIKAVILDMFVAGTETSSTLLEWAISELMKNPVVLKRAQEEVRQVFGGKVYVSEIGVHELEYLKAVLKETMRLHPPLPMLVPRESSQSCEINGYTIPAKTQMFVNAWAIGRDPDSWNEAEEFQPERFLNSPIDYKGSNFELIPFGSGKRICPGITFGVANVELPLAQLLYYFNWELPNGTTHENLDMTEAFGNSVRRERDLFVIPFSYNHVPLE